MMDSSQRNAICSPMFSNKSAWRTETAPSSSLVSNAANGIARMLRTLSLVVTFVALLTLTGCGERSATSDSEAATPPLPQPTRGKPRIALIMKSLANEFFSTMAEGAKKHQQSNPHRYELVVNGINDERDVTRQAALVEEMIGSGVAAIVIAPADSKALIPAIKRAREAGITVVNIDNRLDAEVLKEYQLTIPFVGPNNRRGAEAVGKHLVATLQAGDEVAIIEGIRTSFNAQQRLLGFQDAANEAGLKIVDSQSAEWEMSQANTIAGAILSEHPNLKAILAANDSMALGALAAVKTADKLGQVKIVGFDNIAAVQQAIRDGQILATADQHGDQLAADGIEFALQRINNSTAIPSDRETAVDLITKDQLR
jgi:ribose transport system substrate-binding protein